MDFSIFTCALFIVPLPPRTWRPDLTLYAESLQCFHREMLLTWVNTSRFLQMKHCVAWNFIQESVNTLITVNYCKLTAVSHATFIGGGARGVYISL